MGGKGNYPNEKEKKKKKKKEEEGKHPPAPVESITQQFIQHKNIIHIGNLF
jgi:hypothetical protein